MEEGAAGPGSPAKVRPSHRRDEPPVMGTLGTQLCHPAGAETPLPDHSCWGGSLLTLCFPKTPPKMDFSWPSEQGSAKGAGLAPVDVSSAVYPLLSHKRGILLPTPPLPSDQDPKIIISSWPVNH